MLSSTSSLVTFSKAVASNRSQGGTSRYNSPLDAPRAGSSFFRKRPSSSSCRGAKRGSAATAFCLHTIRVKALALVVESLLQKGAFELAPFSSLGYYSRLFFVMKALGSCRPVVNLSLLNLIVLKIHHPEGGVSASSDASDIQIVSSVHGVRQSLPIHGSLLWSLRGSAGLHAGHGSDFGVSPQSWIRHPPESRFFFL